MASSELRHQPSLEDAKRIHSYEIWITIGSLGAFIASLALNQPELALLSGASSAVAIPLTARRARLNNQSSD